MSAVFPIEPDSRYRAATATAGQTAFTVPYPFQDNADLVVIKTPAATGVSATLEEGDDYTLTGAGSPSGGTVTLTAAAAAGDRIEVLGQAVLSRLGSIVAAGRYASAVTDSELDRNRIIQQEQAREIGRAFKAPLGAPGGSILAGPEDTLVKFDADGNLVEGPSTMALLGDDIGALGLPKLAANRAALKSLAPPAFTTAILTEAGREGVFVFRAGDYTSLVAADTQEGVYIEADDVVSSSGAWVRATSDTINARWFGAVGDGNTDDATAIQAAIDFAAGIGRTTVRVPCAPAESAVYAVASPLVLKADVSLALDVGVTIKAAAAMAAMLTTGVGSNAVHHARCAGGRWDANFLAEYIFHLKQAINFRLQNFSATRCGAYVDGTSEDVTAYVRIGDPTQTASSFEVYVEDFYIYRNDAGAPSPTPAPAQNYGIYSDDDAADCRVSRGVIEGTKEGMYGKMASWLVTDVHPWGYPPSDGTMIACFHPTTYGGVTFVGCNADLGQTTDTIGFKFEGNAVPSRLIGCWVNNSDGTDNNGTAISLGTGVVLAAIGTEVRCASASHRLATDFSGDLSGLKVFGHRNTNVVTPTVKYGAYQLTADKIGVNRSTPVSLLELQSTGTLQTDGLRMFEQTGTNVIAILNELGTGYGGLRLLSGGNTNVQLSAGGVNFIKEFLGVNKNAASFPLDVSGAISFSPGASVTPANNGDVVFQLTSNTSLTVKAKGSDGTVRSASLTLS